ncbi:DUF3157 family protein [Vibrio astriarenae]|uniref:DUF3157 family protein n=1 Tax=Vibrio astriarenae TaxID=1481923 RepID=UPI003736842F
MKSSIIPLLSLLLSTSVFAAQTVTLEDGRQAQLNDDFTWQYVVAATEAKALEEKSADVVVPLVPALNQPNATTFTIGDSKPTLQLSDSGIDLILGTANYANGAVTFPTAITNQSSQAVILVTVEIVLYDMNGNELGKQSADAWLAIKRLADTYLRPKQATQGRDLSIKVPELEQYQIQAKITEVKTRSW